MAPSLLVAVLAGTRQTGPMIRQDSRSQGSKRLPLSWILLLMERTALAMVRGDVPLK
jgi:hypothetical protein